MCRQPTMRAPVSGCDAPNSSRSAISPGISVSAIAISLPAPTGEGDIGDLVIGEFGHLAAPGHDRRRSEVQHIKISLYVVNTERYSILPRPSR